MFTTPVQFQSFFFLKKKIIIEYVRPTHRKTDSVVSLKKKLLELYKSCTKVVNLSYLLVDCYTIGMEL
jgi:hypothetical protein